MRQRPFTFELQKQQQQQHHHKASYVLKQLKTKLPFSSAVRSTRHTRTPHAKHASLARHQPERQPAAAQRRRQLVAERQSRICAATQSGKPEPYQRLNQPLNPTYSTQPSQLIKTKASRQRAPHTKQTSSAHHSSKRAATSFAPREPQLESEGEHKHSSTLTSSALKLFSPAAAHNLDLNHTHNQTKTTYLTRNLP